VSSVAIGRSRDKLRSKQLLARDGVGLPVTTFAQDPKQTEEVVKVAGGAPMVVNLLEGTQGLGVSLSDTDRSAKSVIEAFRGAGIVNLVQEFIKEAGGTDICAFVIGGKVVAAMKRTGTEGDFRSNLHRGGSAAVVKISPEERSTALRACASWRRSRRISTTSATSSTASTTRRRGRRWPTRSSATRAWPPTRPSRS